MYYVVDPFFQNYNRYVLTVYHNQLHGKKIGKGSLSRCKNTDSLTTPSGKEMVPCGLMATSVFNDTFEIVAHNGESGVTIDQTGIAWKSDVDRFENPEGYGEAGKEKSWIVDRYPGFPQGAKNEHFVAWMRPEAYPSVRKPYGWLREKSLRKGDTLTLRINASFPTESLEASKELVLTTVTAFGGRNDAFGIFLIAVGLICFMLGVTTLGIGLICPRRPGERRNLQRKPLHK